MKTLLTNHRSAPALRTYGGRPARGGRCYIRILALILLLLQAQACSMWHPTTVPPRELIERERPSRIRVTTTDGSVLVVEDPEVVNDSIRGARHECRNVLTSYGVSCVPFTDTVNVARLDQVQKTEVESFSVIQTFGTVALAGVVFFAIVAMSMPGLGS